MVRPLVFKWLVIGLTFFSIAGVAVGNSYEKSVIQVTNYRSVPDLDIPWKKGALDSHSHLATYLGDGRFLVFSCKS